MLLTLFRHLSRLAGGLALAMVLTCTNAGAGSLKITTWNLEWLTLRPTGDPALPPDVIPRTTDDFVLLRHYAHQLNSDVIAFQEVDGTDTARNVFDPEQYRIIMTSDPIIQRVGLAIRKTLGATVHSPLIALANDAGTQHLLRSGLDVTLHDGPISLRVLVIHLKTGCWARPLTEQKHSCPILYRQFKALEDWILQRQDEGIAYVVLGDFNRRLTLSDPLMQELEDTAPLTLTTAGFASPCEGGRRFIDHILLGNAARSWLIPHSLRVMTYHNAPPTAQLSDHCPVSVTLSLP